MVNENISAVSTGLVASGVAVIRISGDSPLQIASKMFKPQGKTAVNDFEPYKMYTGEFDGGTFTDYGLCVYFKAPKSYTGEDMVEFHCHGGPAIVRGLLKRTVELGARPANRGEFTKRAFLNGKLSLSSAEGLIDMINSESEGEVKAGYSLYREKLKKEIDLICDDLTYILAKIDADIDFPEEDLESATRTEILSTLNACKVKLVKLLSSYRTGRTIKSGVKVAIVGKPNAGKSSLLNSLLNYDKAIVSSVAGTTRDIVEGSIDINGIKFNFFDTAGIRDSGDEIEGIGINLAKRTINSSDIAVFVMDITDIDDNDKQILLELGDKLKIVVANKTDLSLDNACYGEDIKISTVTGENIEELKQLLFDKTIGANVDLNGDFLTEERHYDAINKAVNKLDDAIISATNLPLDLASIDIKASWQYLGEISGRSATEDIIEEIFKKFCVGK
ncbi:MAG: tRNA uridine-5-carboxymethylaminomethyl(34) synthesis GTPase MnmE [Clostridia bacterium]|nr:tRNA uridine-5-carboxymethylaminomethyl(34) synthesis GTPase MnmE [Clostridia bacterium]